MPKATDERRNATRYAIVLAADVLELPDGAKLSARTSDISRTGCYLDSLNPLAKGSQIHISIKQHEEMFEVLARVMYVSPGLGMGVAFEDIAPEQQARLQRWLEASHKEC